MSHDLGAVALECVEDRVTFDNRATARGDTQVDRFDIAQAFQLVDKFVGRYSESTNGIVDRDFSLGGLIALRVCFAVHCEPFIFCFHNLTKGCCVKWCWDR